MEQLKIKFADREDVPQIVEWLNGNLANDFDPDILKYPTLRIITAYNSQNVSHLPTQQALILESVAVNPKAPGIEAVQALRDMVKGAELLASNLGIKEIYFIGSDETVVQIAKNHGFEQLDYPVLRMKLL